MDERYVFWKYYKYSTYALGAVILISISVEAVVGNMNSVKIILFSSTLIFAAMIAIGSIFCFIKIVILVWTTSSKIAKLLRTDDRQLVFALRRRMYAYISVLALLAALTVIEWVLLSRVFSCGTIVILQVAFHFLEFVRVGVKNLDEYELRERSISAPVDCEGVSQMAPIEPLRPSELEPDSESKQKK
jgi:hypothetical protein